MAGITRDGSLTVEAAFVQIEDHLDHAPGGQLGRFVVFIEAVGDVAVAATNSERAGDEGHGRVELRCGKRFEDLDVLEFLLGGLCVRS